MDHSKEEDKIKEKNNIIERDRAFQDLSTVESQKDNLIPEEFPEGPYGSAINSTVLGKKGLYLESQRKTSAFNYEDKEFHEGIDRQYPGAHPTHDDPEENHENP